MRRINFVLLTLCAVLSSDLWSLPPNPSSSPSTYSDCSHLNPTETVFARKLTPANRQLFCGNFTSSDRKEAMDIAGKMISERSSKGVVTRKPLATPDEAVQIVQGRKIR